jgi:hypothetical protein
VIISDIIINQKQNYDVCVGEANNYNLIIDSEIQSLDITVSGLLSRYDIYGDELVPLIMYLKTNSDVVPYVILLNDTFEEHSEAITMALKSELGEFENSTVISINHQELSLLTSLDQLTLHSYIQNLINNIGLNVAAEVTAISYVYFKENNKFILNNMINQHVLLTVYLKSIDKSLFSFDDMYLQELDDLLLSQMDIINSKMRLIQPKININTQTSFEETRFVLPFIHSLSNILFNIYLYIIGENISSLKTETYLDYNVFLGEVSEGFKLSNTDYIDLYSAFYLKPKDSLLLLKTGMDFEYLLSKYDDYYLNSQMDSVPISELDNADDVITLETFMNGTSITKISTLIDSDIVIEPSANYYWNYMLTSMDDYTLTELESELNFENGGIKEENNE